MWPVPIIAFNEHVKESEDVITSWVKIASEHGFEALHATRQPGRPTKLCEGQFEEVIELIADGDWDEPALSKHVLMAPDVDLSVRQHQRILRGLGDR